MYLRIMLACLVATGLASRSPAQEQRPQAVPPTGTPAPADQLLGQAQLDALVAPIALYPDTLLAQVLMASTYPLEIVQADRWLAANKQLKGDKLKAAAEKQPWDASVKSLVATPSVIEMMSKNLEWTQKLGDAVLAQQADVMDGIQRMRVRAYDGKKLSSGAQQTVTVREEGGKQAIFIAPTAPDTVYVPYYDPGVVYGTWPYPQSEPYYFPPAGYIATGAIATGLVFGAGYALGRWTGSAGYWGGNVNWYNNNINIDRNRVTHWQHNPQHRHGVQYRNASVQQRFAGSDVRAGSAARMDYRGRGGDQVLQPRADGGAGARPEQRAADRAGRSDARPGQRADAGARGDRRAGDRPAAGRQGAGGGSAPRASQQRRPEPRASRPAPARDSAFGGMQPSRAAGVQAQRGQASFAHARGGGGPRMGGGGGGARMGGGGGGARMGGGGGRGGGGRRSDILLKQDLVLLGRLASGIGFYSFRYIDAPGTYVGVMAQEVAAVAPEAVHRGPDGYLRVDYLRLGLPFQSLSRWKASGSRLPEASPSPIAAGAQVR